MLILISVLSTSHIELTLLVMAIVVRITLLHLIGRVMILHLRLLILISNVMIRR